MIHQYKNNGYNIVLDTNSGAVHVVDDLVYDVIGLLDQGKDSESICRELSTSYSDSDVKEAISECHELEEAGQLFTKDIYRDAIIDFKARQTVVKALCLHIAHDCNLACKYCFAEEGEYHPDGGCQKKSFTAAKMALTPSRNHSHLVYSKTNAAMTAAIAAIMRMMGFAASTALNAATALLITPIVDAILGMIVMIVPTADITLPTTIKTGPTAAATRPMVTMIFWVPSSRELSQSTKD